MPGKTSEGFVKAAQKQKFVRNRDLKLKDSELRKEAHVQHVMVEGVCDKCREKLQWRFKYNKYKSLTKPGSCQSCKNKVITKAYRTYCDPCAKKQQVCPGCCGNIAEINAFKKAQRAEKEEADETDSGEEDEGGEDGEDGDEDGEDGDDDDDRGVKDEDEDKGGEKVAATNADNQEELNSDVDEDGAGEGEEGDGGEYAAAAPMKNLGLISNRDFRKMEDYGKNKYDKNRVAGSDYDKDVVSVFKAPSGKADD